MYYIVYGFFYLLSLLPDSIIYFISDCIYVIVYYLIGYRKKVARNNLRIAFPEKSDKERLLIEKAFYHQLVDSFIEIIKLISMKENTFRKRLTGNFEEVNQHLAQNKSVQIHSGHFFNWEYMNLGCSVYIPYTFLGVYMPISNKVFDRIMYKMRGKFGTILIAAPEFRHVFHKYSSEKYAIGLIGDQNTSNLQKAFWYPFFGKPAPIVPGPEKGAKKNNTVVVMVDFHKVKRGYYEAYFKTLTTEPRNTEDGFITKSLIHFIEDAVRRNPANYLWTHRRWKHEYNEALHGPLRT